MEETKPYVMNGPSKMHQPLRLDIQFFAENKVEFGLSNVHYATYEEVGGVITYDTPVPIPGAVTMTSSALGESTPFYADNMVYYLAKTNNGYEATLTIARIPESFEVDVLGSEKDVTDGVVTEIANAQGKPFALLFQFEGDQKAVRHVLYNCNATRPTINGNTTTDTTEVSTTELAMTAAPIELDDKLVVKTKTTAETPAPIYDAWFTDVYRKVVTP